MNPMQLLSKRIWAEMQKPPKERNPSMIEDLKLLRWYSRLSSGLPAESEAEQDWRKEFYPSK